MRNVFARYPHMSARIIEIITPSISWVLITMPFWLSFWHPALVAYLVITFDVYWFYKSFSLAYNAVRSFLLLTAHTKINWFDKAKELKNFSWLFHVIIIPEFKEPLHILERTLENLTKQSFPKKRMIIVLATEKSDPFSIETSSVLQKKFQKKFGHFLVTRHTLRKGEVAGKSSNMASAGKEVVKYLKSHRIPIRLTMVTSCDADSLLHPQYLSCLSYKFLTDNKRYYHFFQGAILFYSNIWRVPLPSRVLNTISSIFNLSLLSQKARLINFSTYSVSLYTVKKVGFWGRNVIPEDYHLFFKTYFKLGSSVCTKPIFLPILADAAESRSFWRTIINQYEQYKRWAWGISDIPFVVKNYFTRSNIPFWDKTARLVMLLEQHILWPTNWFILTLGSTIPPLVNPLFARTVLGHNLSQISSSILTLSAIFLLVILIIDLKARPPKPKEFATWKLPFLYLQWLTLPVISFFLSALPGLDAHTRLLLGKRLKYRVTEKV